MDTEELIIPVRFEYGSAAADLKTLSAQAEASAKKSADAQVNAAKDAEKRRTQAAKEAAALIEATNRRLAQDAEKRAREAADAQSEATKEAAREQIAAAKQASAADAKAAQDAAAKKKQAEQQAFQAWKAQQDVRHREAMKAWEDEQKGIKATNNEIAKLIKTQMSLSAVQQLGRALGDEFRRAADYTREVAMRFAEIRQAIQVVAGLKDKENSDEFTLEHVEKATKAGMMPEEFARAQEAFLNPAAAQLEGPDAKMTPQQAEEFQIRVARLAKSKGYDPADSMNFAGAILQQAKGPLSVDEAMKRFNQGFGGLQKGPIDVRQGVGMMSGLMAHGLSAQESATLLNVVAPVARPGEELTSAESALKAIEEMRVEGKGEEFGVTDKMPQYEALKAFGRNIAERDKALKARGMTDEEAEIAIAKALKEAGVASDVRERRGLVRGVARRGIGMGEFERFEDITRNIAPDADLPIVDAHFKGAQGRAEMRKARLELERAKIGYKEQSATAQIEEAEIRATGKRQFNRSAVENLPRHITGAFTGVDVEGQIKNEEALLDLRRRAVRAGIREGDLAGYNGDANLVTSAKDAMFRSQESVNAEIRDLLRLLVEAEKRKEKERRNERQQPRPLPAGPAPPMPRGR